ncbi:hypothetical protein ACSBR2_030883 [Camellia fascicularis]
MHFRESIKEIINEEFGDGIMSAIDFYCSVDKVKGVGGKDRVVLTFDGNYLPYTEQVNAMQNNSNPCFHSPTTFNTTTSAQPLRISLATPTTLGSPHC